jgi:hypothetical protein
MRRHSCCNKQKVKRGLWSPEEDEKLINYISIHGHGHGSWTSVPKLAGNYLLHSIYIFYSDNIVKLQVQALSALLYVEN